MPGQASRPHTPVGLPHVLPNAAPSLAEAACTCQVRARALHPTTQPPTCVAHLIQAGMRSTHSP